MENEVKKSKGNGLIIALLIIVILGLTGFIIYDKVLNKENTSTKTKTENKDTKEEVKEENLDKNSVLVQDLYSMVTAGNGCYKNWIYGDLSKNVTEFEFNKADDATKMKIVAINLENSKKRYLECNNSIPAQEKTGRYSVCELNSKYNKFNSEYAFDKNYIEMVYKKIFGSDKNLNTSETLFMDNFGAEVYSYVSSIDKYVLYLADGVGGTCAGRYEDSIEKAIKKDNKLLIYENEIFYQDNENKTSESKYIYTFEKDESTGLYYFVSRLKEK